MPGARYGVDDVSLIREVLLRRVVARTVLKSWQSSVRRPWEKRVHGGARTRMALL